MKRLIGALILTLAFVAARQAGAAESNCFRGPGGTDSGPCSNVERAIVTDAVNLIEDDGGHVDASIGIGSAVTGAVAFIHSRNMPCTTVSMMLQVSPTIIVMSCDHKTHIYSLIADGGKLTLMVHEPATP